MAKDALDPSPLACSLHLSFLACPSLPSSSLRINLFEKEKTSCITVSIGRHVLILKNVSLSKLRFP